MVSETLTRCRGDGRGVVGDVDRVGQRPVDGDRIGRVGLRDRQVGDLRRSSWPCAVLLPGVLSFGEDTVGAVRDRAGCVTGAVTTIVMFGASPDRRGCPPVRLHVTVPETCVAGPVRGAVALTNVVPAGSVSTTLTAEAGSGPALLNVDRVGQRAVDRDRIRRVGLRDRQVREARRDRQRSAGRRDRLVRARRRVARVRARV